MTDHSEKKEAKSGATPEASTQRGSTDALLRGTLASQTVATQNPAQNQDSAPSESASSQPAQTPQPRIYRMSGAEQLLMIEDICWKVDAAETGLPCPEEALLWNYSFDDIPQDSEVGHLIRLTRASSEYKQLRKDRKDVYDQRHPRLLCPFNAKDCLVKTTPTNDSFDKLMVDGKPYIVCAPAHMLGGVCPFVAIARRCGCDAGE